MYQQATYTNWDFNTILYIIPFINRLIFGIHKYLVFRKQFSHRGLFTTRLPNCTNVSEKSIIYFEPFLNANALSNSDTGWE